MTRCRLVGVYHHFRKNFQGRGCGQQVPPKLNTCLHIRFRFQSSWLERKVSWGSTPPYFTMKMEAVWLAENMVNMCQTERSHKPEHQKLHLRRRVNILQLPFLVFTIMSQVTAPARRVVGKQHGYVYCEQKLLSKQR